MCGLYDHCCKVLPKDQRTLTFMKRGIWIPKGARCCRNHFYGNELDFSSLESLRAKQMEYVEFDANKLQNILSEYRQIVQYQKTFDFDDPHSLANSDYYNITGLEKGSFNMNII